MTDETHSYTTAATPTAAPRSVAPHLWVVHHPDPRHVGASLRLEPGETVLGRRGPELGGALADRKLSRRHCRLQRRGLAVTIEDLGSRNGTTVDGRPITRSAVVEGSRIGLGNLLLVLGSGPGGPPRRHPRLVGVSPQWGRILDEVEVVAGAADTVLITGEPGVGKELIAREIHAASGRRGPFLALNCAGVPDTVLHSELFGHVKGAFSGAHRDRAGLVAEVGDGTLLLDEIGDATPAFQASLLRLLQEREYRPVGSDRVHHTPARFLAATNRDLSDAVASGAFRLDLWTRMAMLAIQVPPLRERPVDIAVLAHHLAEVRLGAPVAFTRALAERLLQDRWPGNVRGLGAVIARLALDDRAPPWAVPDWLAPVGSDTPAGSRPVDRSVKARPTADALAELLRTHGGNVREVAGVLGVGRNTLYRWLKDAGIELSVFRG